MDTLTGSRHKNLKELHPGSSGRSEIRILFAFDPRRQAILLVAGDKAGAWKKWYATNIPWPRNASTPTSTRSAAPHPVLKSETVNLSSTPETSTAYISPPAPRRAPMHTLDQLTAQRPPHARTPMNSSSARPDVM